MSNRPNFSSNVGGDEEESLGIWTRIGCWIVAVALFTLTALALGAN